MENGEYFNNKLKGMIQTRTLQDVSILKICIDDEPKDRFENTNEGWQLRYITQKLINDANDFLHQLIVVE